MRARRGFTLVEILVVITIIGLLVTLAVPAMQKVLDRARVTACKSNLKDIGQNLQMWTQRHKNYWPRESGIRFLLVLARDGMVPQKDMGVFLCPGTNDSNGTDDPTDGSLYADWDALDSTTISYAGRDAKNFPISKNRAGEEVIAADDNELQRNHAFTTNFLYADGSVAELDVGDAVKYDLQLGENEGLPIGPDSPIELFQKLLID